MIERLRGGERARHQDTINTLQRECASILDIAMPDNREYRTATWTDSEGHTCQLESQTTIETEHPYMTGRITKATENNYFSRRSRNGTPMEFRFRSDEKGIHFCDDNGYELAMESPKSQRIAIDIMVRSLAAFPKQQVISETSDNWELDNINDLLAEVETDHRSFEQKITRKLFGISLGIQHEKIHEQFGGDQYMISRYHETIDEKS